MSKSLSKAKTAYEKSSKTVAEICADYNVSNSTLYRHAKHENWLMRNQRKSNRSEIPEAINHESPQTVLGRLKTIARAHVIELEAAKQKSIAVISSSERERNIRSLRTVLKILEEIINLENRLELDVSQNEKQEFDDKLRQELTQRIEALRR